MSGTSGVDSEWHPEPDPSGKDEGQTGSSTKATTAKIAITVDILFELPIEIMTAILAL